METVASSTDPGPPPESFCSFLLGDQEREQQYIMAMRPSTSPEETVPSPRSQSQSRSLPRLPP